MSKLINVGLDFGSLNYRAAYMSEGKIIPMPVGDDPIWSGSIILVPEEKDLAFSSLKRQVGAGRTVSFAGGKEAVEDIILRSLKGIKRKIEEFSGEQIGQVTISVPARYSSFRRSEILKIAGRAGLNKASLINDSTAAVLAYTFDREVSSTLLVYSMGYIGYEISLMRVAKQNLREIAHDGDNVPAGVDFDYSMILRCIDWFRQQNPSLRIYREHLVEINEQIVQIKQQLSVEKKATAVFSLYTFDRPIPLMFDRSSFEEIIASRIETTMESIDRILDEANMNRADVDNVLLVGGSTHIDYIQKQLEVRFGSCLIQPRDDMLARGAAIQADKLQRSEDVELALSSSLPKQSQGNEDTPIFITVSQTGPLDVLDAPPEGHLEMTDPFPGNQLEVLPTPRELRGIEKGKSNRPTDVTYSGIDSLFRHIQTLIDAGDYQQVDELLTFMARKVRDVQDVLDKSRHG
jgi:actin-like ATPase involved in cell morphogenesis